MTGLLTDLPRKNCDVIAAAVAGTSTERLQHLLTDATRDKSNVDRAKLLGHAATDAAGKASAIKWLVAATGQHRREQHRSQNGPTRMLGFRRRHLQSSAAPR